MKPADKAFLDGLRKSVCVDIEQGHWDLVVKAVDDAGDIRDVTGYARTIILEGVEKARFASRSEAGRYAANMRWRGSVPQGGLATAEARQEANAKAGRGAGNPARGGSSGTKTFNMGGGATITRTLSPEAQRDLEQSKTPTGSTSANSEEAKTKQAFIDSQKERLANLGRGTSQVAYMALESGIKKLEAELASGDTSEARNRPGQFFDDRPGAKGEKYIGRRPVKEVAVDIRRDIKDAVSSGELPTGLKFSVKSDTRGTNAVRVRVSGTGRTRDESGRLTGEAKAVYEKVSSIVNAYNRDNSDMMTDYFDTDYYGTVQLDD